ncbi:fused MFS/spermidine synthase [Sphingomonas sp. KR1UV-12]|uniref:Fused MFS/spermidine synthase n=1 Tax=Sphingomonas aurea TaxID=3063994 RepID=A0ABT9EHR4_9SPHN|nr:fused MFS/spermidine synthase [Sphingomonas sp. KR1UV-12]MDP1026492.1 fused MFS/spermidine synthase [Sphingomonas sp. KR1UV-12]
MSEALRAPDGAAAYASRALFVLTILTGSFLLFLVQPMVARMALPRLGGAPAVWNSAMLVYQALLLGGYAYAHGLGRLRPRVQGMVHLGVLLAAALWLPIGLTASQLPADAQPALWAPWLLLGSIGPLFFAVSAQAPLVQRWFSVASGGRDPYALYAASNLGSFAGLIAYPLMVEPLMAVRTQSLFWSGGYVLLAALVVACVATLPRGSEPAATAATPSARPSPRTIGWWIALALVPSGLMLATSTYITTDIVAMPLLWVLPLGLYLLSFTVAFADRRGPADFITRIAPITILLFGGVMMGGYQEGPWFTLGIALALLFIASVALHTALYRCRPSPDRLTGFYLAMAAGGALGGVFAGLVAPVVFDWTYEYPLLILAAGALAPQTFLTAGIRNLWWGRRRPIALAIVVALLAVLLIVGAVDGAETQRRGVFFLAIAAIGLASVGMRPAYVAVLATSLMLFGGYRSLALSTEPGARTRSYFGVYTIRSGPRLRELDHGTTVHGIQLAGTVARERTPTTYYAPGSGVGQAMQALPALYGTHARVGVVGLGTGTLACYARPGQSWRFYEIDPAVIRIARDTGQFTYLSRCLPHPEIVLGDARVSLARAEPASLDLLVLDAFSSDAVPMHLMTREAFAAYARVVGARGLLLVHISNRFLDLEPVVAAAAQEGGWAATLLDYKPSTLDTTASHSLWIALSRDPEVLARLTHSSRDWRAPQTRPGIAAWTDDYSTILPLLKRP